jgi:hypothetical protein
MPQLTQTTGTFASRRPGSSRCSDDRGAVGRVVDTEVVDPAALGAEVVLHVDDDKRGAAQVNRHDLVSRIDRQRQRRGRRGGHVDVARR